MIEAGWFNPNEVIELETAITGSLPQHTDLYDLFAGQPYLTHAAAADSDFRDSVRVWMNDPSELHARPVRGAQAYRRHLNAIKFAILGPTWEADQDARQLLESFVKACSGQFTLDNDHKLFLATASLVKGNGEPALSLYRLIAEDFRELIEN